MEKSAPVILVIEDDPHARRNLAKILSSRSYDVREAATGGEAIAACQGVFVNIALIDMRLPDIDGLEVMHQISQLNKNTISIVMTGYASLETAIEAMNMGAYSYITKPMSMDEVFIIIDRAVEKQRLALENQRLMEELVTANEKLKESQMMIALQAEAERKRNEYARQQAELAVLQYQSRLQAVFDASLDAITVTDAEGNFLAANRALLERWQKSYYELVGHNASEVLKPEIFAGRLERIQRVISTGQTDHFVDESEGRVYENTLAPIGEPDGSISTVAMFSRDITEAENRARQIRRLNIELEQRVKARTAQLASANKELESFSLSVSHDLQAPLRRILGWNQALMEDYGPVLDEEGHACLQRSCSEARSMSRLIKDLLKFSHVSRYELNREPVDLSEMARTVVSSLRAEETERQVEITVQSGLKVVGDQHLLEIVLNNLFSNALKFTSKTSQAIIEFGRTELNDEEAFFLRDNGAGFDMAYADNLFGPFQRMHRKSDFPGTGIGLALVQRIIHRHGGRVWAESEPDKGAAFYFTLPGVS